MATTLHVKVIRRWRIESLVAVVCIVAALPAWAQTPFGAIDGVVRDESGGVLPGVTVAIASPALIEGARTTVTDAMGTYQFLRLPVGTYIVKFSLSGFKGVVRENVIINASFTATINASLEVGALEETVTVTARRRWSTSGPLPVRPSSRAKCQRPFRAREISPTCPGSSSAHRPARRMSADRRSTTTRRFRFMAAARAIDRTTSTASQRMDSSATATRQ